MRTKVLCILLALLTVATTVWAAASIVQVRIVQGFSPQTVTISAGDTVAWVNGENQDHSIVAQDGSFASNKLKNGQRFQHRFTKAGTYPYGCSLHPREKGKVVVK